MQVHAVAAHAAAWLAIAAQHALLPAHATPVPTPAGRFGLYGWLRMLVVSYFSNLVGALLLVRCRLGAGGLRLPSAGLHLATWCRPCRGS